MRDELLEAKLQEVLRVGRVLRECLRARGGRRRPRRRAIARRHTRSRAGARVQTPAVALQVEHETQLAAVDEDLRRALEQLHDQQGQCSP